MAATSPCPKCHGLMVLRTVRDTGKQFWGCASFPTCRGSRNTAPVYTKAMAKIDKERMIQTLLSRGWKARDHVTV